MENAELVRQLHDLKGRLVAADFAIKMLITHLPDLKAFQDHWAEQSSNAADHLFDNSNSSNARHGMSEALKGYASTIDAQLNQRR